VATRCPQDTRPVATQPVPVYRRTCPGLAGCCAARALWRRDIAATLSVQHNGTGIPPGCLTASVTNLVQSAATASVLRPGRIDTYTRWRDADKPARTFCTPCRLQRDSRGRADALISRLSRARAADRPQYTSSTPGSHVCSGECIGLRYGVKTAYGISSAHCTS
jgi:hypothetical protein